jgi:hypothetical protein
MEVSITAGGLDIKRLMLFREEGYAAATLAMIVVCLLHHVTHAFREEGYATATPATIDVRLLRHMTHDSKEEGRAAATPATI